MSESSVSTCRVGPIPFAVLPFAAAVAEVVGRARSGRATAVHFANAYTIALADSDPAYAGLFRTAEALNLTDGMPVAWLGRRAYDRTAQQWPRIYGPDVMEAVLDQDTGLRHYLLGGSPATLQQLRQVITHRFPAAEVVGAESPPFRAMTDDERAQQNGRIREAGAQMVWVGLGTPKQDWEVQRLATELRLVALAVGAAFDFLAGTKAQAPVWMQRSGTEWAYRLAHEPRRLARRYLWGNPRFLVAAARNPGLRRG